VGVTITWNEQVLVCPQLSLADTSTMVVPIGNVLPLGGVAMMLGGLQPPDAEAVKNTTAPVELVAVTVRLLEHVRLMGLLVTMTLKLQVLVFPHES
jgi:hypothetical protein